MKKLLIMTSAINVTILIILVVLQWIGIIDLSVLAWIIIVVFVAAILGILGDAEHTRQMRLKYGEDYYKNKRNRK